MLLASWLFSNYPRRMIVTMFAVLIAGIFEGISIVALLPLLAVVLGDANKTGSTITQQIQDALQLVSIEPTLENLLLIIIVLIFLKSIFMYFATIYAGYTTSDITADIRKDLIMKIMRAEYSLFTRQKTGDVTAIMIYEAQKAGVACMEVIRMLAKSIEIAIFLTLAAMISLEVTLGSILVGVCAIFLLSKLIHIARVIGHEHNQQIRSFSSNLVDGLGIMKSIKAMGQEKHLLRFFKSSISQLRNLQHARIKNDELLRNIQEPVRVIAAAICLYAIINLWEVGTEALLVLLYLFIRLVNYFGIFHQHYHNSVKFEPAFWSVRETVDMVETFNEAHVGKLQPKLHTGVELCNINFKYGENEIFHELNMFFPAHQMIAISGPSGVGKTTLTDLICGLIKPDKGEILIDSCNLNDCDLKYWRQEIGYVSQEIFLLHDSIYNNVTLGDPDLNESEVEHGLIKAGAWEFISKLPDGIQTVVGERGTKFSSGQRQRISIARALVRNPKLLILDEVTASLDKKTELNICETLKKLTDDTTIIAISHQPAMLEIADIVFRLDQGKLTLKKDETDNINLVNLIQ